jgi:aminoglycoside phosphotransferase (APT) family kinase protein
VRFGELLRREDLPFGAGEMERLRMFAPRFAELCHELATRHPVHSIQHDDLHHRSLFQDGTSLRILDWGDSSIAHPFASLVVTFRFLEEFNGLSPTDPWFARLRDAYLEPWGSDLVETFDLAMRVGMVAQLCAWLRHRDAMDEEARRAFDQQFGIVLRRALARAVA